MELKQVWECEKEKGERENWKQQKEKQEKWNRCCRKRCSVKQNRERWTFFDEVAGRAGGMVR